MARGKCSECGHYGNKKIKRSVRCFTDWMRIYFVSYYFCNEECLEKFEAGPNRFILEDE